MALRKLDEIKQQVNSLSDEEKLELARYLAHSVRPPTDVVDISKFYGKIAYPEDGLVYQHRIRAEWDR
jgi:hypothetical protein